MIEKVHPQSAAENIFKYSCLAQCYIYCAGIQPDDENYIKILLHAQKAGKEETGIDADYTVLSAEKFLGWLTGKRYAVTKKVITSLNKIIEPTPVKYYAAGFTPHFVVVAEGEIVFNPMLYSNSVEKGRPIESREIKLIQP